MLLHHPCGGEVQSARPAREGRRAEVGAGVLSACRAEGGGGVSPRSICQARCSACRSPTGLPCAQLARVHRSASVHLD